MLKRGKPQELQKRPQSQHALDRVKQGQAKEKLNPVNGRQSNLSTIDYVQKHAKLFSQDSLGSDLNFDQFDTEYLNEVKYSSDYSQPKHQSAQLPKSSNFQISDTLARAQNLLKQKQDVIKNAQVKKKLIKNSQNEDMFMTGIGMEEQEEKIPEPPIDEDDDDDNMEHPEIDEEQYIKDLMKDEKQHDDLEELRKMIRATQRNIENYAEDLYSLKSSVSEANMVMRGLGRGIHEYVFIELDNKLNDVMPDFNKNNIFPKDKYHTQLPQLKPKPTLSKEDFINNDNRKKTNVNQIMGKQVQTTTNKTKSVTHIRGQKPIYEV